MVATRRAAIEPRRLEELRTQCKLEKFDVTVFLSRLEKECEEALRTHPALHHWVHQRLSLLSFRRRPFAGLSETLHDIGTTLDRQFFECYGMAHSDAEAQLPLARQIVNQAIEAAAQAVCEVLGHPKHDCRATANLMLPVNVSDNDGPLVYDNPVALKNRQVAADIWQGENFERCLVVVAETRKAGHLGFWVPLLLSPNGDTLPGAPTALLQRHGSAVFKDDLPDLKPFGAALAHRWRAYIEDNLHERLFVSIPFVAIADNVLQRDTVAVLNVNAHPPDGHDWNRAYHGEWLDISRKAARPFLQTAMNAMQLIVAVESYRRGARLDVDLGPWHKLPALSGPQEVVDGSDPNGHENATRRRLPAPHAPGAFAEEAAGEKADEGRAQAPEQGSSGKQSGHRKRGRRPGPGGG
jgi:hypothetical protein